MSPRPRPRIERPLIVAAVLLLAIAGASVYAERLAGAPPREVQLLALFLTASGVLSLLLGWLAIHWLGARMTSLRLRLALAYGIGLLVVLVNVLATSILMFLSPHDLSLLVLLLAFAGVISLAFAYAIGGALTTDIGALSDATRRLAAGDLSARVGSRGSDELGRMAAAFDTMADQLERAFARERALDASRRELVTAVSHDLRTPLATTRAMVEALADGVVTEPHEVRRYLSLILREIQHLSGLIDDLFELSQIDSGALSLRRVAVDVGQLVSETLAAYRAPAAERGIQLAERLEPGIDMTRIEVDPERMQRVLRNLLDNALRHTPAGGIVQVAAARDSDAIELRVSDSGSGVAPDDLERIFDRFYRVERSRRRDGGGVNGNASTHAGLGLAIARGLVAAHSGRIWAEPSPLGGVSIRIALPIG